MQSRRQHIRNILKLGILTGVAGCTETDVNSMGSDIKNTTNKATQTLSGGAETEVAGSTDSSVKNTSNTSFPDQIQLSNLKKEFSIDRDELKAGNESTRAGLHYIDRKIAYFAINNNALKYDVDARTILWKQNNLDHSINNIQIARNENIALVISSEVTALDGGNGEILWRFDGVFPMIEGEHVWMYNKDDKWVKVNLESGDIVKKIYASPFHVMDGVIDGENGILWNATAGGCFPLLVAQSTEETAEMYAAIANSGANWPEVDDKYKLLSNRNGLDAIAEGADIVAIVGQNYLATFNKDGIINQKGPIINKEIQKYRNGSLVTDGNNVYLTTTDNSTHERYTSCYEGLEGELLWTLANHKVLDTRSSGILNEYMFLQKGGTVGEYGIVGKKTGEHFTDLKTSQGVIISTHGNLLISSKGPIINGYTDISLIK